MYEDALNYTKHAMKIHKEGSIIVGIYTYEIAEQKGMEATNESRSLGYPLQIKIEKE